MHILYIHQYFKTNDQIGGTRSYDLARRLIANGHKVTIVSGNISPQTGQPITPSRGRLFTKEIIEGLEVVRIALPFAYHGSLWQRVALFIGFMGLSSLFGLIVSRPDIVYATSTPITVGVPALITHFFRRVPFVFEVRDLWPDFPIEYGVLKNPLLIKVAYFAEYLFYRYSAHVVTTSAGMAERIVKKGVPHNKVTCVPIGADVELFHPGLANASTWRRALGIGAGTVMCLYAGTLSQVFGLDTLVDAARVLEELETDHIRILMIGDGGAKQQLVKRAMDLGLSNLSFLPPVPRRQLAPLLASADICVITNKDLPAARAFFQNKLFDYLASGRPVLVNFPGDTADLLTSTGSGVVVPAEDPEALACAIRDLSANPRLLADMGARARQAAEEQFDRRVLYQSLVDVVESVAASSQA